MDVPHENDLYNLSNTDSRDNAGLAGTSLIQPIVHSANYKDIKSIPQITESPPGNFYLMSYSWLQFMDLFKIKYWS